MEEKNVSEIAVPSLNAEAVNQFLSAPQNQSATGTFTIKVSIYEQFGRAFISWNVPAEYAVGSYDHVMLKEDNNAINSWTIGDRSGSRDTGHIWGSGLNGSYWAMNYVNGTANKYMQLVVTPNT